MAYSFPLSLASLADLLRISAVTWDVQRFDEYSGTGSGHDIQAELAKPKWLADIELAPDYHNGIKQIAAVFRKLQGSQNAFMLHDPLSRYPQSDADGTALGASAVQINTVGTDGHSLRLKGLPTTYQLTIGDKGQINFGSGRVYFFEVSETVTAVAGVTPSFEVFPHLPEGIAINQAVILSRPACKMILLPGSFNPGQGTALHTRGARFKAIERK